LLLDILTAADAEGKKVTF